MWVTEVTTQGPCGKKLKLTVQFDQEPDATDKQDVKTSALAAYRRAYGEYSNRFWEKTWETKPQPTAAA